MPLPDDLMSGVLLARYKRFLADVRLPSGERITVHCPNSGSMLQCAVPGFEVRLSHSDNPRRKHAWTLEMVHNGTCWIGVNTHRANRIVEEALRAERIRELAGYSSIARERPYGRNSRIDFLLEGPSGRCFVEVKNVTLVGEDRAYCFPDAVTTRGRKHLGELASQVSRGDRAAMLYLVQRSDGTHFRPAADIDPAYAEALRRAHQNGVEILAYRADVTPAAITLAETVSVHIP